MEEELKLKKGMKIVVGDKRKNMDERVVAEGIVEEITDDETVVHLNTGYYIGIVGAK